MRFLLLLVPAMLGAQAPDCNLARRAYDNPFSDGAGFQMRRYEWHAARVGSAYAIGEGVRYFTKMPRWASYTVAGVSIGIVPHVRGLAMHKYKFDARDWAFDAGLSFLPLLTYAVWRDRNAKVRVLGTALVPVSYLAGACYASP